MKFKKLVESFDSKNNMTIRVASGLNADGCDIIVTDAEGNILHKEEYRYGYNASYNRKWAEWYPEKPYMKDIIDELCTKYGIVKSDIIFKCGANVFSGTDVTDAAVTEFKNNYVESLTETYWIDSKDVMDDDVDFGYKVCLKDGSKHIVEINNDRVDEINENIQESADAKPQYVICGITNDSTRMLYDAVNDNFTTDYDSATKYDDMEVARDDWFKIPRSGFRRIFIPVYDPAVFECVTEAFDADKVQKRIACTTEFDNGHVFHNDYFRASSAEAEERARQASIENPDKVFYVKYDDVMNPSSDIKWKNGEQLNEADGDDYRNAPHLDPDGPGFYSDEGDEDGEPIYFDPDDEFEVDFRYYVYANNDDVVSDAFDFEEDAITWAQENNYPIVKIHNYYRDTDGELNPDGDPEIVWEA